MPRNISFALTTQQFRDRTKTVTRRLRWINLKSGDVLCGCVKCMGLKPGESIERLGLIRVVNVRREPLDFMDSRGDRYRGDLREVLTDNAVNYPDDYGNTEAGKEGFPNMTGSEFVDMFCQHMGVEPNQEVTRIEFEYIEECRQ